MLELLRTMEMDLGIGGGSTWYREGMEMDFISLLD